MLFSLVSRGFKDVVFADYGTHWKVHRKLMHQALISFGGGSQCLDNRIKMEADALNDRLRKSNGLPVDCSLEFGRHFSDSILRSFLSTLTN